MDELRFQITEDMEGERLDKCMGMLLDSLSRSFHSKIN